ncbi:uncharacterized protein LOC108897514 isoform X1 [Lates calcarifer]|nr:uncharacterized protein LOC108897514 isoform X1 [Lates calcarifer]
MLVIKGWISKSSRLLCSSLTESSTSLFFSTFTMRLYGALILFMTLSTVCGLRCYTCDPTNTKSCTDISDCPPLMDHCFSANMNGIIRKGCMNSALCVNPMSCCDEDLCNSASPTGTSVILLLVSSAIITLFL